MLNIDDFYNVPSFKRFDHLVKALEARRDDYNYIMEFGVQKGRSINKIARTVQHTVYGFDSFKGLPEAWDRNKRCQSHKAGHFAVKKLPEVEENVELIVGLFKDTIPSWKLTHTGPIAFIHIDSDLYSSACDVLFGLNNQILEGTIIVFDELKLWGQPDQFKKLYPNWAEHEWKALNEWVSDYNRSIRPLYRGQRGQSSILVEK